MHCYILDSNTIIIHKQKTFINHVEQSLINIDFDQKFYSSIVLKKHAVFVNHTQFLKMTKNTSPLIKETDYLYIPIGKTIDLIFEETKPINYEHSLKGYINSYSAILFG